MPALYVMRHAEPAIAGVLLGQSDPPLSENGRRNALALAGTLPDVIIYSSPLRRARETAERIGSEIIYLPDLKEISYGEWDGLIWLQIEAKWPELAAEKLRRWHEITPPGGEAWPEFQRRVRNGLRIVASGPLPALIVAHEAVNAIISQEILGSASGSYQQDYCEIIQYEL